MAGLFDLDLPEGFGRSAGNLRRGQDVSSVKLAGEHRPADHRHGQFAEETS
jgi:hypothetical protein